MKVFRPAAASRRTSLIAVLAFLIWPFATRVMASDGAYDLGFHDPADPTELSWNAQPGATQYQLLRATRPEFPDGCTTFETFELCQADATEPQPGELLYYLVRVLMPDPGSWGLDSNGSVRTVSCMAPPGGLVDSYGCKQPGETRGGSPVRSTQDCIEYQYLGGGQLLLDHVNTAFNCCPEFEAGIEVIGDAIVITEDETWGECDCICLFDLSYEIAGLAPGVYHVTVHQEYLEEGDEPLGFTIDLLASPSGLHCVTRDHYPW